MIDGVMKFDRKYEGVRTTIDLCYDGVRRFMMLWARNVYCTGSTYIGVGHSAENMNTKDMRCYRSRLQCKYVNLRAQ